MDTSNSTVAFITGSLRISTNEITAAHWREILEQAVQLAKPHIKHFPEYRTVGDVLNGDFTSEKTRRTGPEVIEFESELGPQTRFHHFDDLASESSEGGKRHFDQKLMLAQDGRWFAWRAYYEVVRLRPSGCGGLISVFTATNSAFSWVSQSGLELIIEEQRHRGLLYLIKLKNLVGQVLGKRRRQTEDLSLLYEKLVGMDSRIIRL